MSPPPFKLTKSHILTTFAPLSSTDPSTRATFFTTISPTVSWTITGTGHSLAGTRHTLEAHKAATFDRLGKRLTGPIRFTVSRVILDAEPTQDGEGKGGWWACVETKGEATRKSGGAYNNEYMWVTRWDAEGKIVEIVSYFDTMLAEMVLREDVDGEEAQEQKA